MNDNKKKASIKQIFWDTIISGSEKIKAIKKDVSYLTIGFLGTTTAVTELSRGVVKSIEYSKILEKRVEELEKTNSMLVKMIIKDSKSSGMDVSLPDIKGTSDDDSNKPN
jgi:hypothetical protein